MAIITPMAATPAASKAIIDTNFINLNNDKSETSHTHAGSLVYVGQAVTNGLLVRLYIGFNSYTTLWHQSVESRPGMPAYSAAFPPDGYYGVNAWSLLIEAMFTVPAGKGGTWTFWTKSDDGSALWIDGTLVVDNNLGVVQGPTERTGTISLTENTTYHLTIKYGQNTSGWEFSASWQAPAGTKQKLMDTSDFAAPWIPDGIWVAGVRNLDLCELLDGSDTVLASVTASASGDAIIPTTGVSFPVANSKVRVTDGAGSVLATSAARSISGGEAFRLS